jgi:trk system potassium uptake protein TrkA
MHTIVVGCGRIGSEIAGILASSGDDVVVIDKNADAFRRLGATFNGITLRGPGTDDETLKEAGIEHCDSFAAVTNSDAVNMMAAQVASRVYRVPRVVIRLYMPEKEQTARLLGLDYVGDAALTVRAMTAKLAPASSAAVGAHGGPGTVEFTAGPRLDGRTVREVQIPGELRICLVTREGTSFIPWRDTRLRERDVILAMVKPEARKRVEHYRRAR